MSESGSRRRQPYSPPLLDRQVRLFNSAEDPDTEIYANRYDRGPVPVQKDGVTENVFVTVWTIRCRPGITARTKVVSGDKVYECVDSPTQRGGPSEGLRELYLELHTQLRR